MWTVVCIILTAANMAHAGEEIETFKGLEFIREYILQTRPDWQPEIKKDINRFYVGINQNDWSSDEKRFVPVEFTNLDELIKYHLKNNRRLQNPLDNDGCWYGNSFAGKNEVAINYLLNQLKLQITREEPLYIADLGCGLGSTACLLMQKTVNWCKENSIAPNTPIELHLLDLVSENQKALKPLKDLVSYYYSQYFNIETGVYDAVRDVLPENKFDFICAFNVMHFIAESKWSDTLRHFASGMKTGGLLLLTTDRAYNRSSNFIIGYIRIAPAASPSDISCIHNANDVNYLNDENEEIIPGAYYSHDKINLELINTSKETREKIQDRSILLSLGNYVFNEDSLKSAFEKYAPHELEALPDPQQVEIQRRNGQPVESVALAFIKK